MTLRPASLCHLLCRGLLRCASLLVPGCQREEWRREWRSELWHVRESCTPERGICWAAEREVAAFCLGAFQDALCLREHFRQRRIPLTTIKGSATQCILLLVGLIMASYGVALLLPGASAVLRLPRHRDARDLVLVHDAHHYGDLAPTISAEQYQTWRRRSQKIFDGFAFYRVMHESVPSVAYAKSTLSIASASANLFELLGLPVRFTPIDGEVPSDMPRLILSDEMWKKGFGGDPYISGRKVRVGTRIAVVGGVAPAGSWKLPGKVDAWLLEPDPESVSGGMGFVVAHLTSTAAHAQWGESWYMTAPKPDGSADDFLCVSLRERMRGSQEVFWFAILLACLALPATTSLPLGEYRLSSRKLPWSTRLFRWAFLGGKIALLLPIVYLVSLDLAHLRPTADPLSSEYIQLVSSFSICLFGLRWAIRDQRKRCPVCLRKLTHPARVGQPSRNFLAWNGMELICMGGHGLLHVPEMPTSWFSEQRWLYLDPSWEVLFAEPGLASAGYF